MNPHKGFIIFWWRQINLYLKGVRDSKLSICVRLLFYKSNWNIPNLCLEAFTKLLLDLTPPNMSLSKSYYDAKRLVLKLGFEAKKINCCLNVNFVTNQDITHFIKYQGSKNQLQLSQRSICL